MELSSEVFKRQKRACRAWEREVRDARKSWLPKSSLEHFDRLGKPINLTICLALGKNPEYSRVAETQVGPFAISTVWLGFGFRGREKTVPPIFETMVFNIEGGGERSTESMERYTTEALAWDGHLEMVRHYSILAENLIKSKADLHKWLTHDEKAVRQWAISLAGKIGGGKLLPAKREGR